MTDELTEYERAAAPYLDDGTGILRAEQLDGLHQRAALVLKYAWAIPSLAAIAAIRACSPHGVIEIGAGTGYWAHLIAKTGVDVRAYDIDPPASTWHPVQVGGHQRAADDPQRTLFLCWPPYNDPMAYRALSRFRGNTVVYVGEDDGGCTGDKDFHAALAREWKRVRVVGIPRWWMVHDVLMVYERCRSAPIRHRRVRRPSD